MEQKTTTTTEVTQDAFKTLKEPANPDKLNTVNEDAKPVKVVSKPDTKELENQTQLKMDKAPEEQKEDNEQSNKQLKKVVGTKTVTEQKASKVNTNFTSGDKRKSTEDKL